MNDIISILKAFNDLRQRGVRSVLATIVSVKGSAYRRPGARMLFSEDGSTTGFISAACLQTDLLDRARSVLQLQSPALADYDTSSPDDVVFGLGLGCNGFVRILLEPLDTPALQEKLRLLQQIADHNRRAVLATVFAVEGTVRSTIGEYLLLRHDTNMASTIEDHQLAVAVELDADEALRSGTTDEKQYTLRNGSARVFIEVLAPSADVVIVGATPDVEPLVVISKELGWNVIVVDHRPAFATKERFPQADSVLVCPPEEIHSKLSLDSHSIVVLMTHHFETDLKLLKALLPSPVNYIGMLGSSSRRDLLLEYLAKDGITLNEGDLQKLHAPVGLDIGAETPAEIALAIASEIQATLTHHEGGSLRDARTSIH